MKMWRVMFNDPKRNTGVEKDKIGTEREAKNVMKKCRKTQPDVNFFCQEYEESREQSASGSAQRI